MMSNAVGHLSLRDTAAWATLQGMKLSNPAVLKRLKHSGDWLGYLVGRVLAERMPAPTQAGAGYRLRLIDATTISAPGSQGTDWRLHVAYDLEEIRISEVELTDGRGGESLTRFDLQPGELAIADRGYAKAPDLAEVEARGADYIVRTGWNATRLRTATGGDFDLLAAVHDMTEHAVREFQLTIALERGNKQLMPVRLVALRKSDAEAEASIRRARKESRRHGKTPQRETLDAAKYVFLLTSLEPGDVSAEEILALIACVGRSSSSSSASRACCASTSCRTSIPKPRDVGSLQTSLPRCCSKIRPGSSWTLPPLRLAARAGLHSLWRVQRLLLDAIVATVIGAPDLVRIVAHAPDLRRHLVDPPRRRKRQLEALTTPAYQS